MKIALASVIYKQASQYLEDLINSVKNQTEQDFDLLIMNDNYSPTEFSRLELPQDAIIIDEYEKKLTPPQLRMELLLEAKARGYDLLIIADADDTFVNTRVEQHIKSYKMDKNAVFYYNNLVTDKGLSVFESLPNQVTDVRPISQANFLGMSTTSINLNQLGVDFIESLKKNTCAIFDWYLYSRILLDVGYGVYVPEAETVYRLHDNNLAGITTDVDREKAVKLEHYAQLGLDYPYFKKLKDDLEKLDLSTINTEKSYQGYWWSNIIMEEHYEI